MKNFKKIALGLAVMIIAFGFSAFKAQKNENTVLYAFESGMWVEIDPSIPYSCTGVINECTKLYEVGKNPTDNPSEHISVDFGTFTRL